MKQSGENNELVIDYEITKTLRPSLKKVHFYEHEKVYQDLNYFLDLLTIRVRYLYEHAKFLISKMFISKIST